jgi:hypothetical protein
MIRSDPDSFIVLFNCTLIKVAARACSAENKSEQLRHPKVNQYTRFLTKLKRNSVPWLAPCSADIAIRAHDHIHFSFLLQYMHDFCGAGNQMQTLVVILFLQEE